MYELIDLRTGETIAEYFTYQTALIRCNALNFVYGYHYAIRPTFDDTYALDKPLPTEIPK